MKNNSPGGSHRPACDYSKKERGDGKGKPISRKNSDKQSNLTGATKKPDWATGTGTGTENMAPGTSIFDPVLCELAYSWFSFQNSFVLDPFAGGSVRGLVAAKLNRNYIGIELRKEQVDANRQQSEDIARNWQCKPTWIEGDSRNVCELTEQKDFDFIFSCPPYGDLEVYSDLKQDISTLPYQEFKKAYFKIICESLKLLKQDRFACFVVGDFRDKKTGIYQNFVSDTIEAFKLGGAYLYNEAILVTSLGSLPIRAGKQFDAGRKLGKTHQNVLVFIKGDPQKATQDCGKVDIFFGELEEEEEMSS